jgi:pyrroloquinoline quinone biosynthesis protein B
LREGASLDVWAAPSVLELLAAEFPVRDLLSRYADFRWKELPVGRPVDVEVGITVEAIPVADRAPRYSRRPNLPGAVVAVRIADAVTRRTAVWMPQVPSWSAEVEAALRGTEAAYVDGTFWSADELVRTDTGHRLAGDMGHLPVGGVGGIAANLAGSSVPRKLMVHINNTNPILDPSSTERQALSAAGIEVPPDDLVITL